LARLGLSQPVAEKPQALWPMTGIGDFASSAAAHGLPIPHDGSRGRIPYRRIKVVASIVPNLQQGFEKPGAVG
jgi:hypothetical protein